MKLVTVSDLHLDARTAGVSRFDDVAKALHEAVDFAIETKADAFVCLGDVFDPDSVDTAYRALATLGGCANRLMLKNIEVIFLAGNHDVIEGTTMSVLRPLVHVGRNVKVYDAPEMFKLNGLNFLALPFTAACNPYDPAAKARDALREVPEGLIVLSHLNIEGIHPGSESKEFQRGREVFLPVKELRGAKLVLSGHYHRRQVYKGVQIVGSLCRLAFGDEEGDEHGFLSIEV